MKFLRILHFYFKGIRLPALFLTVLMTWAMFWGVITFGNVQYIRTDLDALSGADMQNAYIVVYFPSQADLTDNADSAYAQAAEAALEACQEVEQVFCVRTVNPVKYDGAKISIVLYEPEMLEFFPGLKVCSIDFSAAPDGCVLGSTLFHALEKGDNITLKLSNTEVTFPVAGHVTNPYRHFTLSNSSTRPSATDLFKDGDVVLMQATAPVMEQINAYGKRITYDCNLIVNFAEGTTAEQQEAILKQGAPESLYYPLSSVLENAQESVQKTMKEELPQPLFLAGTAFLTFFCILILLFQKKQRDTSLLYLCGCSRYKCGVTVFTVFQLLVLIPICLNVLLILVWPSLEWNHILSMDSISAEWYKTWGISLKIRLMDIKISHDCLMVVWWYYLAALVISILVTVGTMAKHTPVTFLKGASK